MANENRNDGKGNRVRKWMGDVGRIVFAIFVFLVPIGLAYLFLRPEAGSFGGILGWVEVRLDGLERILLGTTSESSMPSESSELPESSKRPAVVVVDWLERLPTKLAFYCLLAALTSAYLGWRWWLSANIRKEIETKEEDEDRSSLSPRDWWVIREIRRRAIIFRTWASLLLVGVIALLLGGVYFTLFILPQIAGSDFRLAEDRLRAEFKDRFDHRFQLIGEGRYWFKVDDVNLRGDPNSEEDIFSDLLRMINVQSANMTPPVGMTRSRLPVLNAHEITKKKPIILAVGHGQTLVTQDGGQTWEVPGGLELKEGEWIVAAALGADDYGLVVGTEGSVFVTKDGGQTWEVSEGLKLKEDEWIVAAAFGADIRHGVVSGTEGSVFVTKDGGQTWEVPGGLKLKEGEWIVAAAFGADDYGLVAGDEGSVFVMKDGGKTWEVPEGLKLKEDEWIVAAAFGADIRHGVVSGTEGSVFVTKDGGKTWEVPGGLKLKEGEWIVAAAFGADDYGLVAGDEGSVFVMKDGGKTWEVPEGLKLKEAEQTVAATFGTDVRHGVVSGTEGSVFVTQDGGQTWEIPGGLELKEGEWIVAATFGTDVRHGVVSGTEGSVFVTKDGGQTWEIPGGLELKEGEWIVAAAFGAGGYGVVSGTEGSVFVIRSSKQGWISTEPGSQGASFVDVVRATPDGRDYVAADAEGGIHLLKAYPYLATWENRSLAEIRSLVSGDEFLPKSVIGREIINFLGGNTRFDTVRLDRNADNSAMSSKDAFGGFLDDLTVMRIVALTVLFFLVQVLVRLYQYNLRLAVFWDSRADAVLLARSFAYHSAERFDDLVATLAPDGLDFKPLPKSGHEALVAVLAEQLRRGRQPRES